MPTTFKRRKFSQPVDDTFPDANSLKNIFQPPRTASKLHNCMFFFHPLVKWWVSAAQCSLSTSHYALMFVWLCICEFASLIFCLLLIWKRAYFSWNLCKMRILFCLLCKRWWGTWDRISWVWNEVKREFCIYERILPEFYAFRKIILIGKFEIFEFIDGYEK